MEKSEIAAIPSTVAEALAAGYHRIDTKFQRGYVSRRSDINALPVHVAGGSRRGELYYLSPSWKSTTYCYRVYLAK